MRKKKTEIAKAKIQPSRMNPKDRVLEKPEWRQQDWETNEAYAQFQRWYIMPNGSNVVDYLAINGHTKQNTGVVEFKRLYDAISALRHNYLWNERTKAFLENQRIETEKELERQRKKDIAKLVRNLDVVETSCLGVMNGILKKMQTNEIAYDGIDYKGATNALMRACETIIKHTETKLKFLKDDNESHNTTVTVNVGIEALQNIGISVHGSQSKLLQEIEEENE